MKVGAWTSENGIVLNGFSEENGILYYKGSPIGSSASAESVSSSSLPAVSDVQIRDYGTPYVVQQGGIPNDRYCKFLLQGSIADSSRGNKTPIPVDILQSGTDYKLPVIDSNGYILFDNRNGQYEGFCGAAFGIPAGSCPSTILTSDSEWTIDIRLNPLPGYDHRYTILSAGLPTGNNMYLSVIDDVPRWSGDNVNFGSIPKDSWTLLTIEYAMMDGVPCLNSYVNGELLRSIPNYQNIKSATWNNPIYLCNDGNEINMLRGYVDFYRFRTGAWYKGKNFSPENIYSPYYDFASERLYSTNTLYDDILIRRGNQLYLVSMALLPNLWRTPCELSTSGDSVVAPGEGAVSPFIGQDSAGRYILQVKDSKGVVSVVKYIPEYNAFFVPTELSDGSNVPTPADSNSLVPFLMLNEDGKAMLMVRKNDGTDYMVISSVSRDIFNKPVTLKTLTEVDLPGSGSVTPYIERDTDGALHLKAKTPDGLSEDISGGSSGSVTPSGTDIRPVIITSVNYANKTCTARPVKWDDSGNIQWDGTPVSGLHTYWEAPEDNSPALYNPVLWFDASGLSQAAGTSVTSWIDSSGSASGRVLTANVRSPVYVFENNMPWVRFTSNYNPMSVYTPFSLPDQGRTIILVMKSSAGVSVPVEAVYYDIMLAGQTSLVGLGRKGTESAWAGQVYAADPSTGNIYSFNAPSAVPAADEMFMLSFSGTSDITGYMNTTVMQRQQAVTGDSATGNWDTLCGGSEQTNYDIFVNTILIYDRNLSASEISGIYEYYRS